MQTQSNPRVGSFDPVSSSNSQVFLVDHSLWLYAVFPGFLFVIYCILASLSIQLSDSSLCASPVLIYLYLSLSLGYCFLFFLCYLFLFGRPKTRTFQNTFLGVFSSLNLVVTVWGSYSLYSSGIVNSSFTSSYNSTQPEYAAAVLDFLNSTPCTRSFILRIAIFGLSVNYFYYFLLILSLLYTFSEFCCCRGRVARTEILGLGGIQRTRARKIMEIRLAREAGMTIVQEEFMKKMNNVTGEEETKKEETVHQPAENESLRLVNRSGWTAATP